MSNHIRTGMTKEQRAANVEAEAETLELDRIAYLRSVGVEVCARQCESGGACGRTVCTGASQLATSKGAAA